MQKVGICTGRSDPCGDRIFKHIAGTSRILTDNDAAVLAVFSLLSIVPSEELAYTEGTVGRQIDIGLTTVTIGSKIFSHCFLLYASLLFSASRYRPTASCQVGSGVNPASRSFDLSRRELNGRAATLAPYSALVTGTTFVV